MRADPSAFQALDLRAHQLLADVPIHDVWSIELQGGNAETDIRDVRALFTDAFLDSVNPVVKGLFALRKLLGRLFEWDRERPEDHARSFSHRLTAEDRAASLVSPGTPEGPFRVLYAFPKEALAEAINRTVHAFSCMALAPKGDGHTLYWAIYVRETGLRSRLYMAMIKPFRHVVVYPSILAHVERSWRARVSD